MVVFSAAPLKYMNPKLTVQHGNPTKRIEMNSQKQTMQFKLGEEVRKDMSGVGRQYKSAKLWRSQ